MYKINKLNNNEKRQYVNVSYSFKFLGDISIHGLYFNFTFTIIFVHLQLNIYGYVLF